MPITLDGSNGITTPTYGGADTSEYLVPVTQFKNRIINGAMVIDQRNAGASVTVNTSSNTYSLDRWFGNGQATDGVFTIQQSSTAPQTFTKSLLVTVTTADASIGVSQRYLLGQAIEGFNVADLGWGTANAQSITLSFQVRSSLTGTFSGSIVNSAFDRSYPFSFVINSANTFETKTITISGDTSGTWLTDNGVGVRLYFNLGSGSSVLGTAGSWSSNLYWGTTGSTNLIGTNGATFYITGVQLEVGSTATSFDYRPYGTELALCQRYLPAFGTGNINLRLPCSGICASSTIAYITVNFPITTRVQPTGISISSASHFTLNVDGLVSSVPTSIAFTAPSSTNANRIVVQGLSGLTTGQPAFLDITNTSGQLLFTGCEL